MSISSKTSLVKEKPLYGKKNLDGILLIDLKYKTPIYTGGGRSEK